MEQTALALTVAGVVAPWVIELSKIVFGDLTGKKALTLSLAVSVIISAGVLWYQGVLNLADPMQLLTSFGYVVGLSTTVYQYMQKYVDMPADKVRSVVGKTK